MLGLGRLGGLLAHPRVRPRHHLSPHSCEGGASDGAKPLGPNDYFNRLASRVTAALSVPTAAGPLYDVDARLRPEGAKGMLVVSLDAFERYQREEAWTWEHMALCRARPVFGSPQGRDGVGNDRRHSAHAARFAKVAGDAAKMRADMERHKPPRERARREAWARAGWSISNSRCTCSSSPHTSA